MNNLEIKNQNGRSMIEMLGVLAIIGVLSVGGIAGYSKAMTKYRINKTIEQITLIAGNIRAFWGPQKNYDGVDCNGGNCNASGCYGQSSNDGCPIVKKAKIFPDEMITVTDGKIMSITNPFGYVVSLSRVDKSKSGDKQAFYINYRIGDNEEACIELLTQDWSNANVSIVGSADNMVFLDVPPLSVDEAITICEDEPTSKSLDFYFDAAPSSEFWKEQLEDCSAEKGGC